MTKYAILQIGAGSIFFDRYLHAISSLSHRFEIVGVVDVRDSDQMYARLKKYGLSPSLYSKVDGSVGSYRKIIERLNLNNLVVSIATPTSTHVGIALECLAAGAIVALEKPPANSLRDLKVLRDWIQENGTERFFLFGYYIIEKALPLLALSKRGSLTEAQHSLIRGVNADDWNLIRHSLGRFLSMDAALLEGPDSRDWAFQDKNGGQTLDTFSHLLAITLLWLNDKEISKVILSASLPDSPYPNSESVMYGELSDSSATARLAFRKFAPEEQCQRWVVLTFEHGQFTMDLEKQEFNILLEDGRRWHGDNFHPIKYVSQFLQLAEKLAFGKYTYEMDVSFRSTELAINVHERIKNTRGSEGELNDALRSIDTITAVRTNWGEDFGKARR